MVPDEVDGEVDDVQVDGVTASDFEVLRIADDEATVGFTATLEWSGYVTFANPDSIYGDRDGPTRYIYAGSLGGRVSRTDTLSGTLLLHLGDSSDE